MAESEHNNRDGSKKVSFETAIDRAGFGLYSYSLVGLSGFSIISFYCIAFSSSITVPSSACELETTSAQQGLLFAAPLVANMIGALFWGYLGDTKGRRRMLLVSLLCGAAINAIVSISVHWVMLMILQFTAVLFASGQYTLSMTLLSESVPMVRRNLVVLLVTSIFMLSQGIMAVLAIPIIPLPFSYYIPALDIYWNSWRTLILAYCMPSFISAIWLFLIKESPKYVLAKGDEDGALEILRSIHRMNNRRSKKELQVEGLIIEEVSASGPTKVTDQIVPLFKKPLIKYTLIMTTLSIFLQVGSFMVWLPTIANQFVRILQTGEGYDLTLCDIFALRNDTPPDPDAVLCALDETALLIVLGVAALSAVVNGSLNLFVNRTGRRNAVMMLTLVCGLSGVLVNLVPNAIASAVLFAIFLVGMILMGLYTAITMTLFPTHLKALAVALMMTGGYLVNVIVIQVTNLLFTTNCELAFYIFGSLFAASAIVASFLPDDRLKENRADPEIFASRRSASGPLSRKTASVWPGLKGKQQTPQLLTKEETQEVEAS